MNEGEIEMFIFYTLAIVVITTTTLHWQFKFGKTGKTFKAFCLAVAYTIFTFQFLNDNKLLFIILFFYVTIALWCIVFASMTISKQWAMDPKEEPYHN